MRCLFAGLLLLCASAAQAQQMRGSVEAKDCSPGFWSSVAAATGLVTCGSATGVSTSADYTWTGTHKFGAVFGRIGNGGSEISGATYTVAAADCGTTLIFTSASAVTVTIPASLVTGSDTCSFGVWERGAGAVSMTGTAVSAATRVSKPGWTKTSGQDAMLSIAVAAISGTTYANIMGDGAP